jgi:hypothetical protein
MVNRQNWWHLEIIDEGREARQAVLMDVLAAGGSWTLILKLSSGWLINIPPLLPTWAPHLTNNPRLVTIINILTIMLGNNGSRDYLVVTIHYRSPVDLAALAQTGFLNQSWYKVRTLLALPTVSRRHNRWVFCFVFNMFRPQMVIFTTVE